MPDCNSEVQNSIVNRARQLLSAYEDMAELIRLGAYRRGSDPLVDEAIHYFPMIDGYVGQGVEERSELEQGYQELAEILGINYP